MRGIASIVGGLAQAGVGNAGDVLIKGTDDLGDYQWQPLADVIGGGLVNGESSISIPVADEDINHNVGNGFVHRFRHNDLEIGTWSGTSFDMNTLFGINNGEQSVNLASVRATNNDYDSSIFQLAANKVGNTDFNFIECISDAGTSDTLEFKVDGEGRVHTSNTLILTGADYAEAFEWEDGNPDREDRIGITVTLAEGGKVRQAVEGDDILGATSGKATVIGNAYSTHWHGIFHTDEYGRNYLDAEGNKVLSKDFDPTQTYVPRLNRPEWVAVGVLGQIIVRKDQVIGENWVLIKPINEQLNLYWVK